MALRYYQDTGLKLLADKIIAGAKRVLAVLPTGGGKTIMFAAMTARYLTRSQKNVLILVHREELLKQARQKLYHMEGVIAEIVVAGVKHWPPGRVHVAMVETAYNRMKKKPDWFKNVGLVIIDEAHMDSFSKTFPFFEQVIAVGYTATPIASNIRKPMKDFYDDIVVICQIDELVQLWRDTGGKEGLCPNITFNAQSVMREELKLNTGGEFDEEYMSAVYSTGRHVKNAVLGYEKFAIGKKTLVFNCNKNHSKLVNEAFLDAGYPSKHFDSDMPKGERQYVLDWFAKTPDAILNNIGILTTGFDDPTIQWIMVNRSTNSASLWLQINGRGSRPWPGKNFFGTIDMGGNCLKLGEWSTDRDWKMLFNNPRLPIEGGIGGVKECRECGAYIPVSARSCKWCNAELIVTQQDVYDQANIEFKQVSKSPVNINISELISSNEQEKKKSFYTLHQIKHRLINHYKVAMITDEIAYQLLDLYQAKVEEWCRLTGEHYTMFIKEKSAQWLLTELKEVYSWVPPSFTIKF